MPTALVPRPVAPGTAVCVCFASRLAMCAPGAGSWGQESRAGTGRPSPQNKVEDPRRDLALLSTVLRLGL